MSDARAFDTLVFEQPLPVSPTIAWLAWSAPFARAIWGRPGPDTLVTTLEAETSLGGLERVICQTPGSAEALVETRWLDLSPPYLSVNSEVIRVNGLAVSSALITAEISRLEPLAARRIKKDITPPSGLAIPAEDTSLLRLTLQISANSPAMTKSYSAGFAGGLEQLEALTRRMMVVERHIKASPSRLWAEWTDPARLCAWWGPDGFSCRTERVDLREGGEWLFEMIGPDGTTYPNLHRYGVFSPERQLSYRLYAGVDAPLHAEAWVDFEAIGDGSHVRLVMIFRQEEDCGRARAFGAEQLGLQTLAKLASAVEADE